MTYAHGAAWRALDLAEADGDGRRVGGCAAARAPARGQADDGGTGRSLRCQRPRDKRHGTGAQPQAAAPDAESNHRCPRARSRRRAHAAERCGAPAGEAEGSDLFRGTLRGRRCLIVLDSAANELQVRPLLPAGSASMVVITSRRPLAGLEDVHRLPVAPLSGAESAELVAAIIGQSRAAAGTDAVERVSELCGKLSLALRIAGNRLLSRPGWRVQHPAGRLATGEPRRGTPAPGDLPVQAG